MNYPALFAFILRLVGLYFLYSATMQAVLLLSGAGIRLHSGWSAVLSLILHLLAAMWFFKGAPPYSGWAYRELDGNKDKE
jgi:hypothetical protein